MNRIILTGYLLFISMTALANTPIGKIKRLKGDVVILRDDKKIPAQVDADVFNGDRIKTGPNAMAQVSTEGNKVLFIAKESETLLNQDPVRATKKGNTGGTLHVGLLYGKIRAKVASEKISTPKIKVYSGTTVAGVRGTELEIIKSTPPTTVAKGPLPQPPPPSTTSIAVLKGTVSTTRSDLPPQIQNARSVDIERGQVSFTSDAKQAAPTRFKLDEDQLKEMRQRNVNYEKAADIVTDKGETKTLNLNNPLGVAAEKSKDTGMDAQRLLSEAEKVGKNIQEPPTVALDPTTGSPTPVVKVGLAENEKFVLSKMNKDPEIKKTIMNVVRAENDLKKNEFNLLQAKAQGKPEAVTRQLEQQLNQSKAAYADASSKANLTQAQLKEQFVQKEIPKMMAEAKNNPEQLDRLKAEKTLAQTAATEAKELSAVNKIEGALARAELKENTKGATPNPEKERLQRELNTRQTSLETKQREVTQLKAEIAKGEIKKAVDAVSKVTGESKSRQVIVKSDVSKNIQFSVNVEKGKEKKLDLGEKIFKVADMKTVTEKVAVESEKTSGDRSLASPEPNREMTREMQDYCKNNPSSCQFLTADQKQEDACPKSDPACNPSSNAALAKLFGSDADRYTGGACPPGDPTCYGDKKTCAPGEPGCLSFLPETQDCDCVLCPYKPQCIVQAGACDQVPAPAYCTNNQNLTQPSTVPVTVILRKQ